MLATDVGDEICWRQLWDVGDGFGHQHPLSLNISVDSGASNQKMSPDLNSVANILKLSPTVSHHHHNVSNMTVANMAPIEKGFEPWNAVLQGKNH